MPLPRAQAQSTRALAFQKQGEAEADFVEFLAAGLYIWVWGTERQQPLGPDSSDCRRNGSKLRGEEERWEQQGWGCVLVTTHGAGISHPKTCLPSLWASFLRGSSLQRETPGLSCRAGDGSQH